MFALGFQERVNLDFYSTRVYCSLGSNLHLLYSSFSLLSVFYISAKTFILFKLSPLLGFLMYRIITHRLAYISGKFYFIIIFQHTEHNLTNKLFTSLFAPVLTFQFGLPSSCFLIVEVGYIINFLEILMQILWMNPCLHEQITLLGYYFLSINCISCK